MRRARRRSTRRSSTPTARRSPRRRDRAHLAHAAEQLRHVNPVRVSGRVTDVIGLVVEAPVPALPIGGVCQIERRDGGESIAAEVVGFRQNRVLLMPLGELSGIEPGNRIVVARERPAIGVGAGLLGRVLDGLGAPLDGGGPIAVEREVALYGPRINPLERAPIRDAARPRRARDQRAAHLRPRPAPRHLRRLRRRQERAARHDRALHARRGERDRADRRARPRGARVHRARPRARGPGALGRGRRDLRPAAARAHPRRLPRDRDRRVLPRRRAATCC